MMQTVSDQVAERLRAQIAGGALAPGETLPAERRLAEQLGVSRGSLRAGIAQLQAEGLLEARHGSGTRVCADLDRAPLDWLSWVLASEDLAPEEAMLVVRQLVGLRRVVVLHILDEALRVMSSDHVARLEALVRIRLSAWTNPMSMRRRSEASSGCLSRSLRTESFRCSTRACADVSPLAPRWSVPSWGRLNNTIKPIRRCSKPSG